MEWISGSKLLKHILDIFIFMSEYFTISQWIFNYLQSFQCDIHFFKDEIVLYNSKLLSCNFIYLYILIYLFHSLDILVGNKKYNQVNNNKFWSLVTKFSEFS